MIGPVLYAEQKRTSLRRSRAESTGHGAWGMEHGARSMGHGAWSMEHGAWGMGHGAKRSCAMRKIEEVVMSEEVKIYTTPT